MSLYYETANILQNEGRNGGSLRSRVYSNKQLKSPPVSVYALAVKAMQWADVLKEVVERSGVLGIERKLTPHLALLLAHDLLISKEGIAAPKNHVLALAISRHKARLSAELTRIRIKRGYSTIEGLRESLNQSPLSVQDNDDGSGLKTTNGISQFKHPRWIRINTLNTTLDSQLRTTFQDFTHVESLHQIFEQDNGVHRNLYIDAHIPNLVAVSPTQDYTRHPAYRNGSLILQDKASCFPAYLLDPRPSDGGVMDACAAPGNKTTHLAALLHDPSTTSQPHQHHRNHKVFACERNSDRATTLSHMVQRAGAEQAVEVLNTDFLKLSPSDPRFANITAFLLDPSCSGSGMLDRSDAEDEAGGPVLALPSRDVLPTASTPTAAQGKKRKRKRHERKEKEKDTRLEAQTPNAKTDEATPPEVISASNDAQEVLSKRLASLSTFQTRLLIHAFCFPVARRVTYSTCSVYTEENEAVVVKVLASKVARERGWRVLRREEQVEGLRKWERRGMRGGKGLEGVEVQAEVAEACIRCAKGTEEGTMGFFVCGFVRDGGGEGSGDGGGRDREVVGHDEEQEEEWEGFSDKD